MDQSNSQHRIEQYLKGQMSAEERALFETELAQDAQLRKAFDTERLLFEGMAQLEKERIQSGLEEALKQFDRAEEEVFSSAKDFQLPAYYPGPADRFGRWLSRSFLHFKSGFTFGITPTFALAGALLILDGFFIQAEWLNAYSIQLIVIALASFWLYLISPSPNYYVEANRASLGLAQFWKWWRLIWVMWLFLYLFLSLREMDLLMETEVLAASISGYDLFNVLIHLANNLASLAIFICYDVIQKDTFRSKEKNLSGTSSGMPGIKVLMPDMQDVFFDAEEIIGSNINKNKYYVLLIAFTAVEIPFLFWGYSADVEIVFGLLSGMIGGVAFGMLFSKLNSKYLGLNDFFFILLITYIVIQPAFNFLTLSFGFEEISIGKTLANVFSYLALALKLILLAIIQWLVYSNQLLYYLAVSAHLNKEVRNHRIQAIESISKAKPVKYRELWKVRKV